MSREVVDVTLVPIDVGFDLLMQDMPVEIRDSTKSVAYMDDGVERVVRGSIAEIIAVLRAAGYKATAVPG